MSGVGWFMGRLVLVDDVDEAGAVGKGEDVGRKGEAGEEGEEEFHVVGWFGGWELFGFDTEGLANLVGFLGGAGSLLEVDVSGLETIASGNITVEAAIGAGIKTDISDVSLAGFGVGFDPSIASGFGGEEGVVLFGS